MKKLYRILLLLIVFIFLSTYNHITFDAILEKKYSFFEIKNIKITNNSLIKKVINDYLALNLHKS